MKRTKKTFIDIRLSQMDPTDLRGIPYPDVIVLTDKNLHGGEGKIFKITGVSATVPSTHLPPTQVFKVLASDSEHAVRLVREQGYRVVGGGDVKEEG